MSYRGVLGAVPYAVRASDSWLFRVYAVVGSLAAAVAAVLTALGLVVLVAATAGAAGGAFTLSRTFYVVVGLLVVVPLLAPVLLVARRHRRDRSVDPRYDPALGAAGFLFLATLYLGLVATVPPAQQQPASGVLSPLVRALYSMPAIYGLVPPALAAGLIYAVHRRLGAGL